jgi:imidazoleglycerol-phosphate dehydratase
MLELLAFHSGMNLYIDANGDLDVDDHHTIEDCGILIGQALRKALGSRAGIARYGSFTLPMDEVLASVNLDISGRPYLVFNCEFQRDQIGMMATEMVEEFMRAFAVNAGITLHVNVHYGKNDHHKAEAIFKALGRALKEAVRVSGDQIPSSKGMLE